MWFPKVSVEFESWQSNANYSSKSTLQSDSTLKLTLQFACEKCIKAFNLDKA